MKVAYGRVIVIIKAAEFYVMCSACTSRPRYSLQQSKRNTKIYRFFLPHCHLTPSLGVDSIEFLEEPFVAKTIESSGYPSVKIS